MGMKDILRLANALHSTENKAIPRACNVYSTEEFDIGQFSSLTAGSGLALSATYPKAMSVNADDGGVAIAATGVARAAEHRLLLTVASSGNMSAYGSESHLKINADESGCSGVMGGIWAYVEGNSGKLAPLTGAVVAHVDLVSGVTAPSGSFISGLLIKGDMGGTHTGKTSGISVLNPANGTWDFLLHLDSSTGMTTAGGTKTSPGTVSIWLNININGTTYYVPAYTSTSS